MKKILALSLFAITTLVSQVWAGKCEGKGGGTACQFDTGCYEMTSEYSDGKGCTAPNCTCDKVIANCVENGAVYSGVTGWAEANNYGKGWKCSEHGGTYQEGKLDPNKTALGCCKWETETNCYTIWSGKDSDGKDGADQVKDCKGGSNKFWNGECPSGGACPTGTPVWDGTNPADGFCCWEGNEYNNGQGACVAIGGETTLSKCTSDGGFQVSACSNCRTTPIIKFTPASQALIVAPFARSLHISSIKDATVSLYDMNGAKVYSGKVRAGNSVFSLEKVASGSYYAIVQSGSDAKKVPVILK
jgi:hypothetical protein